MSSNDKGSSVIAAVHQTVARTLGVEAADNTGPPSGIAAINTRAVIYGLKPPLRETWLAQATANLLLGERA